MTFVCFFFEVCDDIESPASLPCPVFPFDLSVLRRFLFAVAILLLTSGGGGRLVGALCGFFAPL